MLRKTLLATLCATALCSLPMAVMAAPVHEYKSELGQIHVSEIAEGLKHPWALAFLPEGKGILVSERPGTLRIVSAGGKVSAPLGGVPKVWIQEPGGLFDVVLSPQFKEDRLVYLSYAEGGNKGNTAGIAVGRGRLSADMTHLENFTVILRQEPKVSAGNHFGSRLVFDRDGYLFIVMGENSQQATAQNLNTLQGKVVRIFPDGRVPDDNPFVGQAGVNPVIWSYGHGNQQGAALNPWTGTLWTHEHGPLGSDEINIIEAGKNYGEPLSTQGSDSTKLPIPEALSKTAEGTVDPHHVWEKSPGISGMAFYDADRFKPWQHNLFIGALRAEELIRLQFDGDRVAHEERLLGDLKARIRDVRQGPDGYLYVLTDADDGALLKVGLE